MQLGEFGRIYFADFDQVRARERTVRIAVIGWFIFYIIEIL